MLRLVWILAQLLCLIIAWRVRFRLWFLYLCASSLVALFYQPLTDHWGQRFAWGLWLVLACRVGSLLEALHFQTYKFKFWPFLAPGCWLLSAAAVSLIWMASGARAPSSVVEIRRYVHLWLALAAGVTLLFLCAAGAWRNLKTTPHTLLVSGMVWNHANIGLLSIAGPWKLPRWVLANWWSMLIDLLLLVLWFATYRGGIRSRAPETVPLSVSATMPGSLPSYRQ